MKHEHIVRTLRQQAWERAKGELSSMLATFWHGTFNTVDGDQFDELSAVIAKFVEEIEEQGLHE